MQNEKPKVTMTVDRKSLLVTLLPVIDVLVECGKKEQAQELLRRIAIATSYEEVLKIVKDYVDVSYE